MDVAQTEMYVGLAIILVGLIVGIWLIKTFSEKINLFIRDTLKEKMSDGTWKWSKMAMMQASAWFMVIYSFNYDMLKNGFNVTAWGILVGVGITGKLVSAKAKQIDPLVTAPKETKDNEPQG